MNTAKPRFEEQLLGIVVMDLGGWTRWTRRHSALEAASFLDAYYARAAGGLVARGARIVKFMGDGCLAVIAPERVAELVDALPALRDEVETLVHAGGLEGRVGVSVHLATVAACDLGPEGARRFDVVGEGVNHTFLMGRGPGLRISEPVYRRLPSDARGAWDKNRPPATYMHRE